MKMHTGENSHENAAAMVLSSVKENAEKGRNFLWVGIEEGIGESLWVVTWRLGENYPGRVGAT